jgi:hypothetical protein
LTSSGVIIRPQDEDGPIVWDGIGAGGEAGGICVGGGAGFIGPRNKDEPIVWDGFGVGGEAVGIGIGKSRGEAVGIGIGKSGAGLPNMADWCPESTEAGEARSRTMNKYVYIKNSITMWRILS